MWLISDHSNPMKVCDPPALDDDVLEAASHDQPGLQATQVDQRVEHAGAGVDGGLRVFADLLALPGHIPVGQRFVERLHEADALVVRRRRRLADDELALLIDQNHVGHGAAGVAGD